MSEQHFPITEHEITSFVDRLDARATNASSAVDG